MLCFWSGPAAAAALWCCTLQRPSPQIKASNYMHALLNGAPTRVRRFFLLTYGLELLVNLHLMPGDQAVILVGEADHCQHLVDHSFRHTLLARGRSVSSDAIITLVGHA